MPVPGDPQDQLIRAIVAKFVSLAATTFAGIRGPYRSKAPANTTGHPYCVIIDGGCNDDGHTCVSERYESEVELRVYAKTPEDASVEIAKVDGVFSSRSLSLSASGITIYGMRLLRPAYVNPAEGVFYGSLTYRFQLSRTKID